MKPPIPYFGGKITLGGQIAALFPPHGHYVEPYCGSLAVFLAKSYDGYPHEMRAEADHRELAEALHAARAAVVLSGYASDLYDRELYAGWDRHTMVAGTGQGDGWGNRTEVLWSNRPLGRQPQLELWGEP